MSFSWGGWDTHGNNFGSMRDQLPALSTGLAALIQDLEAHGRLEDTLIMMSGEFGRTPRINGNAGRDHWPRAAFFFDELAALGSHQNFTLAAIAGSRGGGHYEEVYVHAKIMLVDDAWATIGSTNVAERSFHRDTELNASFWHEATVRSLRAELLAEHLGCDTAGFGAGDALRRFREVARANADRRTMWQPLEGLAYALDAADRAKANAEQ